MIFKKKYEKYREQEIRYKMQSSYNNILKTANVYAEMFSGARLRFMLDYMIRSLLDDVCSSAVTELLYRQVEDILDMPFPFYFYDENGKRHDISEERKTMVDLANENIYVRPWNYSKLEYHEDNHWSYFYTDINLCYVYNGNHSINAGRYFRKGIIYSDVFDTTLLYPHCHTDGLLWYNTHTNKKTAKVSDFRLAAVYTLAQIRYKTKADSHT